MNEYYNSQSPGGYRAPNDIPPSYWQQRAIEERARQESLRQRSQQSKNKEESSFFKRLFFQWDARMIQAELQLLKLSKSDLVDSAYQKSEIGYFDLIFRALPVASISLFIIFISTMAYIHLFKISPVAAMVGYFLLMELLFYPNAKIIYGLDRYKIGEKETGRFIKIVRNVWHLLEFVYFSTIALIAYYYYVVHIDWNKIAYLLQQITFQSPLNQKLWILFLRYIDVAKIPQYVENYLFINLLFILTYIISNIIVISKAKKESQKEIFDLKKEYMTLADLAREKMGF